VFGASFCKTVDDCPACVEDVIAKPLIRSFERNVLLLKNLAVKSKQNRMVERYT
jgi:hypothetical protein